MQGLGINRNYVGDWICFELFLQQKIYISTPHQWPFNETKNILKTETFFILFYITCMICCDHELPWKIHTRRWGHPLFQVIGSLIKRSPLPITLRRVTVTWGNLNDRHILGVFAICFTGFARKISVLFFSCKIKKFSWNLRRYLLSDTKMTKLSWRSCSLHPVHNLGHHFVYVYFSSFSD